MPMYLYECVNSGKLHWHTFCIPPCDYHIAVYYTFSNSRKLQYAFYRPIPQDILKRSVKTGNVRPNEASNSLTNNCRKLRTLRYDIWGWKIHLSCLKRPIKKSRRTRNSKLANLDQNSMQHKWNGTLGLKLRLRKHSKIIFMKKVK